MLTANNVLGSVDRKLDTADQIPTNTRARRDALNDAWAAMQTLRVFYPRQWLSVRRALQHARYADLSLRSRAS